MTLETDAFTTYSAKGNREDLSDVIYNVDPMDTPFLTSVPTEKATSVKHEWQIDSLASASNQAVLEGDSATIDAASATTRLSNTCQIQDKVPRVTGTQMAVVSAGRKDELAYQVVKRTKELRRDHEVALLGDVAEVAGGASTARKLGGIEAWFTSNVSRGTGGSSGGTGDTASTNGTQRDFTEDQLKTVLLSCWNNGGDPDCIMVGGSHKQTFSTFTGNATRFKTAEDKELTATIEIYHSDFGDIEVIPNRFIEGTTAAGGSGIRSALILQKNMWAVAWLRPTQISRLGKTGDTDNRHIVSEFTLVSRNEAASGIIADLNF